MTMQYKKVFNSPLIMVMLAGSVALGFSGQSFAAFCTPKADELFNDKGVVLFDFEKQANCQTALRQLISYGHFCTERTDTVMDGEGIAGQDFNTQAECRSFVETQFSPR